VSLAFPLNRRTNHLTTVGEEGDVMAPKHPQLSLKGFAQYFTGNPTKQREILRKAKYPKEDASQAQITFYRDSRLYITKYHKNNYEQDWLLEKAAELSTKSLHETSNHKITKLKNTARVLRQYAKHFSETEFNILSGIRIPIQFSGVKISVVPDLHVVENNKEKIIKFEFSANKPSDNMIRVMTQLLFEAQDQADMNFTSASVLVIDIPRGTRHKGARVGSRLKRHFEDECKNIIAIWDTL
jgi:hypothetical protein